MHPRLLHYLEKWATFPGLIFWLSATVVFNIVAMRALSSPNTPVPLFDLHLGYTPFALHQAFGLLTPAQRNAIAWGHLTFDILYPMVYGTSLSVFLLAAWRGQGRESTRRRLLLLPWLAVIADIGENFSLAAVLLAYPRPSPLAAYLAPVFTALKWGFVAASLVAVLVGAGMQVFNRSKSG